MSAVVSSAVCVVVVVVVALTADACLCITLGLVKAAMATFSCAKSRVGFSRCC